MTYDRAFGTRVATALAGRRRFRELQQAGGALLQDSLRALDGDDPERLTAQRALDDLVAGHRARGLEQLAAVRAALAPERNDLTGSTHTGRAQLYWDLSRLLYSLAPLEV